MTQDEKDINRMLMQQLEQDCFIDAGKYRITS